MRSSRRPWSRARALVIALALVMAALPADALDTPGSKNFTAPRGVPNYFSNESGPFNGAAGGQSAPAGSVPTVAAPAARGGAAFAAAPHRYYAHRYAARGGKGRARYRLAHRRGGHRYVVHVGAHRARVSGIKVAHVRSAVHGRPAAGGRRVAGR